MIYSRFLTVLAAVAGSMWVSFAHATELSLKVETAAKEDSLKPKPDTTLLSPEDLALLIEYIPYEPDEVIQDRLSCIEADIPLVFNKSVRNHIDYFTVRNRKYTRTMITRENVYFPIYEKYLRKYNMPQDMKYLSIVESGLNPKAASWAGAVGPWQFIRSTGKEYGLDANQYIDERMDVEKSTDAAMRFLSRLYRTYGDWELAMAAYNCGQGNVNKAIRRAGGGKKTFWEIYPYLPKETRNYIPSMTAVIYAMKYAPEHNIFSDSILYATETHLLEIKGQAVDLEKLAAELHMTPEALLALNPEIKKKELPEHIRNYSLRIPAQRSMLLASAEDRSCILLAAAPTVPVAPVKELLPVEAQPLFASTKKDSLEPVTYTVKRGDNLGGIATRHHVTVEQLREWNDLKGSHITANQKLVVLQPAAASATLLASAEPVAEKAAKPVVRKPAAPKKEEQVYHVQPGDTLWNISQKYNGLTVEQIKKLNKLKGNSIKPGMKLIIS